MELPMEVNGWHLHDHESAMYHRETPDGHEFIDMTWLDTTEDDPEYGTGRECCVCTSLEDTFDFEKAEELFWDHHTDSYCISGVVTKEDAQKIILDYIRNH